MTSATQSAAPPQLASGGILVRGDGQMLLTRHAAGPFAGRWSMPLIGVADNETAEDALTRLLRDVLRVQPGPFEFLDTIYLEGTEGARFVLNAFTCVDWQGEPALAGPAYREAVWAPPAEAGTLDLLPEVRTWIAASANETGTPAAPTYDRETITSKIADARGDVIAAYDAMPPALRREPLDDGWSALDVLAHVADVEAYFVGEARRCLAEPGRTWRLFNDKQWGDLHHLRPVEDEATVRARMQTVRGATLAWLREANEDMLAAYVNHETRGLVQIGSRIQGIADHDQTHTEQLQKMATRG